MNDFQRFGVPEQFEIAAKWSADAESRERLPLAEGWSTGELCITVGGQVLTEHRFRGESHAGLSWYLSPVIDWLIRNWTWLLHEEHYAWPDKSGLPAAVATISALERTISSPDETERRAYESIHAWWSRHAFRAADSSAVYPDIYFRRVADDIEVSWLARQPDFVPEGFSLTLAPGYALLPISAVAEPLWHFLKWATESAPATSDADQAVATELRKRFVALQKIPLKQLEQAYIGERVQRLLESTRDEVGLSADGRLAKGLPAIESLDSAVLMFGGLDVDLGQRDVQRLMRFLASRKNQEEPDTLSRLVHDPESEAWSPPYEEGYRLAEDCRDELGIHPDLLFVDMDDVLNKLGVVVVEQALETGAIRGVAVAGRTFGPGILVNTASFYNKNEMGRRFTLAHELCHILYDRTRARKLSHLSGPWASARTEKRANAFAAMFLAPPSAIRHRLAELTSDGVRTLAREVGMGFIALTEHLCNVGLINEAERDELRQSLA